MKKNRLVLSVSIILFAAVAAFGYGVFVNQSIDKTANVPSSDAAAATIYALARELPAAEGSGMVASKQYPGVFWWHRDGGEATALKPRDAIYAVKFDSNGNQVPLKGSDYAPFYLVSGAKNTNWEDLAIDTSTNTIWLGDIGANGCGGTQDIYKIAEPNPSGSTTTAATAHYTFTFPDPISGCTTYNSEAMFWLDGKLYIFAKTGSSPVYRIDFPSGTTGTAKLVKLGQLAGSVGNISVSSLSTDRKRLLVASHGTMNIYKTTANLSGDAFVKDIISRTPVYKATFNCNCDSANGTVEGGSFAIDSYNVAFVSETKHAYYAKPATYGDGTTTVPANDTTPPTVSITAPTNGATVSGTITINVAANDNSSVTKVDIYVDNNTVIKNDVDVSDGWKSAWSTKNVSNGSHTLKAVATDAAGNSATTTTQISVSNSDTVAPTAPTSVSAVANSPTKVTVAWAAASDNVGVSQYLVQRDGVTIGQTTALNFVDTTVSASKQYSYVVKAMDAVGNVSVASSAAVVKTPNPPDITAPSIPSSFVVVSVTSNQVNLAWVGSTDNVGVAGYKLTRSGVQVGSYQTTNFGDATVQPGTTYTYTVAAYDAAGNNSAAASLTITTQPLPSTALNGLLGNYFNNISLSGIPALARTDTSVNFDWGGGSPYSTIPVDNFSVRWTGGIIPVSTGTYTFYTSTDDGARLWVNGQQIINQWTDHGTREYSGTVALTAGIRYDITMEYYEKAGLSVAKLQWSGPGVSKAIVPTNQLRNK